ncbi:DUF222 domain-containing protein [Arthrobacter sp. JZ12]|uniref:HNH endonuclease signature motif containing protein n=1 Tax=Arthrobacter sp. JZ12 TaxID=2654190 RepID=UPI002B498447|nr:DUF222 domain-containing protein [Arthrobacter sp. JZ12]WRH24150.1 DUF222 domain-containing protein [Arthrobacter sp. JZ12]
MAAGVLTLDGKDVSFLTEVHADLLSHVQKFEADYLGLDGAKVADALVEIEKVSKIVEHLQVVAARAVEDHGLATNNQQDSYRSTADYLRAKIGVSRSEANRRLRLGKDLLPEVPGPGASVEAPMPVLGAAASAGEVSGRAVTIIRNAMDKVRTVATPQQLKAMEEHLTLQAIESDEDVLRALARRWENVLDQDGQEPTDKILKARQGVFLRGRRHGLHFLEIGATDEQFEHLITAMNTATNPRVHGGDDANGLAATAEVSADSASEAAIDGDGDGGHSPDRPTRAQGLLDGLVTACRVALAGDGLPATGGHRPQVMVTINYRDLLSDLGHDGHSVFAQQLSASSIRKIACDADILPLVLGGRGQILDIGRSQRLFPPHMRRALVARDKGCAFPDCTIPATWCEAHHIVPWSAGGTTNVRDGVLLCLRHHHVIHEGNWSITSIHGMPWFRPPKYRDPSQRLRRNRYWQVEEAVHDALAS